VKCVVKTCIFQPYGKCAVGRGKKSGMVSCIWLVKGVPSDMELIKDRTG